MRLSPFYGGRGRVCFLFPTEIRHEALHTFCSPQQRRHQRPKPTPETPGHPEPPPPPPQSTVRTSKPTKVVPQSRTQMSEGLATERISQVLCSSRNTDGTFCRCFILKIHGVFLLLVTLSYWKGLMAQEKRLQTNRHPSSPPCFPLGCLGQLDL